MMTNSQLSKTEPKKQTNKQKTKQTTRNRNRIREMEITWSVVSREGKRGERGKKYRDKKHNWSAQNREVKNSIGNAEANVQPMDMN